MKIIFCNDGVLRIPNIDNKYYIALYYLQNIDNQDDALFWGKYGKHSVTFEDGLTLSNFFKCLEPWKDYLTKILDKDFLSYLSEIRKPSSIDSSIVQINFEKNLELFPEIIYPEAELEKPELTNNCIFKQFLEVKALSEDGSQKTIYHQKLNLFSNTPIFLNKNSKFIFDEFFTSKYNKSQHILNDEANQVHKELSLPYSYLNIKVDFSLNEVVEGFFKNLDFSTEQRDQRNQDILGAINETLSNSNYSQEQMILIEDLLLEQRELSKELKYDGLTEDVFKKALKDDSNIIRIGIIKEAQN